LQEGEIRRVGGAKPSRVDTRVLAATNRDLEEEVKQSRFREDLYYRLNVVTLRIPPLRERREDIPLLIAHMLRWPRNTKIHATTISAEALTLLERYDWPGNVRELENTLEHAAVYSRGAVITPEDLPAKILKSSQAEAHENRIQATFADFPTLDELERRYLIFVLESVSASRTRAAEVMGVDRRTITRMIERYGINSKDSGE
jgi:DNA-binding NtrC family response regulator